MPGAQRRVKPAWHKKLFSHKQTTSHQRDDVPEFGNHREITEHQSADYVCVGYLATLLGPLRKDFTNWPVEKPALPTVAAVVIGLRPFVNEWLPAQQNVSSPEVRGRQRIAPDIDGVSFQSLLRNNMFKIEKFLREKATARAAHQLVIICDLRNIDGKITAHLMPKLFLD